MTARQPPDRRRLLAAALAFAAAPWLPRPAVAQSERLPLRNLRVEVRQGGAERFEAGRRAPQRAAVAVASEGRDVARAEVGVESRGRDAQRDAVQQLLVLNGAQGALRVGATVPVYWVQWIASGGTVQPLLGSRWVDTGRAVLVRPRWPGGAAPVTVELRADVASPAPGGMARYAPDGVPLPEGSFERAGLLTTLQLPLGEWVTVASSGETAQAAERGVLSTRELAGSKRYLVQMRVSLP